MALSDVAKRAFMKKHIVLLNATLTTQDDAPDFGGFVVPESGHLIALSVGYTAEAGTTPALTVTVSRGATVLASATADTAGVGVEEDFDVPVSKKEVLKIGLETPNADNDFTSASAILTMIVPLEED